MTGYKFKILSEAVAQVDQFEGKTHEAVADSIYSLITSSEKSVSIGLEGAWGSGKSTVVNFIRSKFKADEGKTLFFEFDAWAHEGDPLRRIFLESLLEEIPLDQPDDILETVKKEAIGKDRTVTTKTTSTTSKLGGLLSFSAIFVPIGAAIISAVDLSKVSLFEWGFDLHRFLILGVVLSLSPIIALIYWRIFGEECREMKNGRVKKFIFGNKLWDVFSSVKSEKFEQQIMDDGESTSIEFEKCFSRIMKHLLGGKDYFDRVVIVIDNLDRIEPTQALKMWSALQPFFQYRSQNGVKKNEWHTKVWFLVPYDRDGLSNIWDDSDTELTFNTANMDSLYPSVTFNSNANRSAPSFIEKNFQVIAEVPEHVISSWATYVERYTSKSLNEWPEHEIPLVNETFNRYFSKQPISPTPRQIQIFINRVGFIAMRWGGKVSVEAIALYALLRANRSERELRNELLITAIPDNYLSDTDISVLKQELAGLLFGVSKDKGIQFLLAPEIRNVLNSGKPDEFKNLITMHGKAFWIVWHSVRANNLPNDHSDSYRIPATLAFCGGIEGYEELAKEDIKSIAIDWMREDHDWNYAQFDSSLALAALVRVLGSNKADFLSNVKERCLTQLAGLVSNVGSDKFRIEELPNIKKLFSVLQLHSVEIMNQFYDFGSLGKWVKWRNALDEKQIDIPFVLPESTVIENVADLVTRTNAGGQELLENLIYLIEHVPELQGWDEILDSLFMWVDSPTREAGNDNGYELLLRLLSRKNLDAESTVLQDLIDESSFLDGRDEKDIENVPAMLALLLVMSKGLPASCILEQNTYELFFTDQFRSISEQVFDLLDSTNNIRLVWSMATEKEDKVAKACILSGQNLNLFHSLDGAIKISEVEFTPEEQKATVGYLVKNGSLTDAKEEFIKNPNSHSASLVILNKFGGKVGSELANDVLDAMSQSEWVMALQNDSQLLSLIIDKGSLTFRDAAVGLLLADLKSEKLVDNLWLKLPEITEKLLDKDLELNKLAEGYFKTSKDPFSDEQFKVCSPLFSGRLGSLSSESVCTRIDNWLASGEWGRLRWISKEKISVASYRSETLNTRIKKELESENLNDDHKTILIDLNRLLRIDV